MTTHHVMRIKSGSNFHDSNAQPTSANSTGTNPPTGNTRAASPSNRKPLPLPHKHAEFTIKLTQLCQKHAADRTDDDIRFIRDRLHERSPFFKLWPPHLQKLLCYIAHTEQFVKNEVIISRGSKPTHLYFLLEGEVTLSLRDIAADGGHCSQLKVLATLGVGDTFGEPALLVR
eukprot:jgi/Chrzof1/14653/Cz09g10260.t1